MTSIFIFAFSLQNTQTVIFFFVIDNRSSNFIYRGSKEAEEAEEGYNGIYSTHQPGTGITTTATTSGQTTRDGTEDFSAQVWQFCLAAKLPAIRPHTAFGLEG